MSPLLADITRCLGEGNAGRTCIMRQYCRRYLDRNRGIDKGAVSMGMMLCHDGRYLERVDAGGRGIPATFAPDPPSRRAIAVKRRESSLTRSERPSRKRYDVAFPPRRRRVPVRL